MLKLIPLILSITTCLHAFSMNDARMMRQPDINNNLIVFVYAGDIWTVSADGGNAKRLTSHPGIELFPKISPDCLLGRVLRQPTSMGNARPRRHGPAAHLL